MMMNFRDKQKSLSVINNESRIFRIQKTAN